jgi:hypothetical protein
MIVKILAAGLLAASTLGAMAAEKVKVTESVKVEAPPAKVWARIGHPAIKASEASDGDKRYSQRRLDLGGPILWEALVSHSDEARSYEYRILDNGANQKVLPVSHYVSTIVVKPDGQGSEIVWSSEFEPVAGTTAEAAQKAIAGVYRGGLDALAKAEAKN